MLGLLILGVVGIYWMGSQGRHRSIWTDADVRQSIDLAPAKARALFDLLAPDDVAVTVGPHHLGRFSGGREVSIRGTSEDVRTIARFAGLLSRLDADDHDRPSGGWRQKPSAGMCERTYTLSRSKAKSLAKLLAFDDVPVFVTRLGSKLAVTAAPEDQEIIAGVVRILGGKANRCE